MSLFFVCFNCFEVAGGKRRCELLFCFLLHASCCTQRQRYELRDMARKNDAMIVKMQRGAASQVRAKRRSPKKRRSKHSKKAKYPNKNALSACKLLSVHYHY